MIARVADHCLWFGRYLERAESSARLLAAAHLLALDGEWAPEACWRPLLEVSGEIARFTGSVGDGEAVESFLVWEEANPVALRRTVAQARANARAVRDAISPEVWETVNELYLWLGDAGAAEWGASRDGFYRQARRLTQLALGQLRSTMLHDEPLDFIWLGVLLERVGQTARTLHAHGLGEPAHHEVIETARWLTLLRALGGFEPYMRRAQGRLDAAAVAGFLLDEPRFPRSIAYGVRAARERLEATGAGAAGPAAAALTRLRALEHRPTTAATLEHVRAEIEAACAELDRALLGG